MIAIGWPAVASGVKTQDTCSYTYHCTILSFFNSFDLGKNKNSHHYYLCACVMTK